MAAPAGRLSFDSYDLPYIVGMTRGVQIVCCIVQLLMIYSESASLSLFWFLLYSVVCAYNLFHLSKRWYYNIDGRYDLKQFVSQSEPTVRVQYGAGMFKSAENSYALL
ncbi:hypothetical protein OESDEN_15306 [Oesophagostomum dentatum]|uniref:DUF7087 domain-containing protein n=1 Tax=Oesophagostomum dentatum TaxID=61180 RepID=A0A0B1SJ80_OESDE|nr:hypothetical protein OESDEN_15306 [Oesophagostomum dentatum]